MDCRKAAAVNFRTKLGFNQYDPILTKQQLVLTKHIITILCTRV